MRVQSVVFIALAILAVSVLAEEPGCSWSKDGYNFDFTALKKDFESKGEYTKFAVHFCEPVVAPASCASVKSSVCALGWDGEKMNTMGSWAGATFSFLDEKNKEKGVSVSFKNGDPGTSANVQVNCAQTFHTSANFDTQTPTIFVYSPAGCPSTSEATGMSGGSIFLIILVVVIPVYIFVGCIYNHKKKGTPLGCASCPCHDMWCNFVFYAKTGCQVTWGKVRSLCGGSSGSSSSSSSGAGSYGAADNI